MTHPPAPNPCPTKQLPIRPVSQLNTLCRTCRTFLHGFAFFVSAVASTSAQQITYKLLARSEAIPPGAAGTKYDGFYKSAVGIAGQGVFLAGLKGNGVILDNDAGVWVGLPGNLALVREGVPAPEVPGSSFAQLESGVCNSAGAIAFLARLKGPGISFSNSIGIWAGPPERLSLVARKGDPVPGMAEGVIFDYVGFPAHNDAGRIAFFGGVTGPGIVGYAEGLWGGVPGLITKIVATGDDAPETSPGTTFGNFLYDQPAHINSSGATIFLSAIKGPSVATEDNSGIWVGNPGNLKLLARAGSPVPGAGAGTRFNTFMETMVERRLSLNSAGAGVFPGSLNGPEVTFATERGLWSGTPGHVGLLARSGDQAPGCEEGVTFDRFSTPRINSRGRTAFRARVTGPGVTASNDNGIWIGMPGALAKVVREGDPAPNAEADSFYGDPSEEPFVINNSGEIVFVNRLTGAAENNETQTCLWYADNSGTLSPIVRQGKLLDGRVVEGVEIGDDISDGRSAGEDGLPSSFNDAAQVAIRTTSANMAQVGIATIHRLPSFAESWREQHFGTTANTGDSGDLADPDHDGLVNLFERATATDPRKPNSPPIEVSHNGDQIEFIYTRRTKALGSMNFEVQSNGDLAPMGWDSNEMLHTLLSDDGTTQRVKSSTSVGGDDRFMRLLVTASEL